MDNQTMLLKTIGLQKTAFNFGLSIASSLQQNTEALLKTTLEQSPWLPAAGRTACLYTAECSSKYLVNLQSMAEQSFTELEKFSSCKIKPEETKPQQQKATAKTAIPAASPKRPAVKKKTAPITKTAASKTTPAEAPPVQQLISNEKLPEQKQ